MCTAETSVRKLLCSVLALHHSYKLALMPTEHLPSFFLPEKNYNLIIFKIVIPILVRHNHQVKPNKSEISHLIVPAEIKLEEGQRQRLWRGGGLSKNKAKDNGSDPEGERQSSGWWPCFLPYHQAPVSSL